MIAVVVITERRLVDNAVDSWGYLRRIVEEPTIAVGAVWKPVDGWGRRCTGGSGGDLRQRGAVHNPQDLRRQQDLFARMTGELQ
jgi:hypothetical protein